MKLNIFLMSDSIRICFYIFSDLLKENLINAGNKLKYENSSIQEAGSYKIKQKMKIYDKQAKNIIQPSSIKKNIEKKK